MEAKIKFDQDDNTLELWLGPAFHQTSQWNEDMRDTTCEWRFYTDYHTSFPPHGSDPNVRGGD